MKKNNSIQEWLPFERILKNGIIKLKNTKKFSELDYKFKQMAIAFEIWYNLPDKNVNRSHREISQAIVDSKMSEWQQSI